MTNREKADHIFARNPEAKKLHFTSDGQAFYEKSKAEAHCQRLKDPSIDTYHRTISEEGAKILDRIAKAKQAKADAAKEAERKAQEEADAKAAAEKKAQEEAQKEADAKAAAEKKAQEEAEKLNQLEVNEPETVTVPEGNVSQVVEVISTIKTAEELEALAAAEAAGEDRKGVKQAIEKRLEELKSND